MRLYLDEDTAAALLVQVLRQHGHDVETPAGAGLMSEWDPVQLTFAIREDRRVLTRNYEDFEDLHNLVIAEARGHHPGILVIRRDNNPRRNMAPRDIVRALRNLEAAGVPIADQYIVLNGWQ
jgi:predicted nuclease of predicted toxin-antitoxin system